MASCGIKFDIPTIILSECVLVYLEAKSSESLLAWFSEHFTNSVFINYEQVNEFKIINHLVIKNNNEFNICLH